MGKFNPKKDYENWRCFDKKLDKDQILLLKWTEEYLKLFEDPVIESEFNRCVSYKAIGLSFMVALQKRYENIPVHKETYRETFENSIIELLYILDNKEKYKKDLIPAKDMLEFFLTKNYLTVKQMKYIKFMIHFNGKNKAIIKFKKTYNSIVQLIFDSRFRGTNNIDFPKDLIVLKARNAGASHVIKLIEEFNKLKSIMIEEEKKKVSKKKKANIKNKFVSLNQMRKNIKI
jgi:hypothetical protein